MLQYLTIIIIIIQTDNMFLRGLYNIKYNDININKKKKIHTSKKEKDLLKDTLTEARKLIKQIILRNKNYINKNE